jgi:hypothetical protein
MFPFRGMACPLKKAVTMGVLLAEAIIISALHIVQ